MGYLTTIILLLIPVLFVLGLILAFMVVKKIIKIAVWVLFIVLLVGATVNIYGDVSNFEYRNTLFLYENDGEIVNGFIGLEEQKAAVNSLNSLVQQLEEDPESLYQKHHKVVVIKHDAFSHIDDIELPTGMIDRAELDSQLADGTSVAFQRAYEESNTARWYIRNLKSGQMHIEPEGLAFRLAKWIPYSFVGGQP